MNNWWGSIREKSEQIKAYSAPLHGDVLAVALIVLVGVSAFGLGRLSAYEQAQPPVRIHSAATTDAEPLRIGGMVVASQHGTKYHYPWCAGAQAMNEENKRWFKTIDAARAAGYTPAGNCSGLQ